MLNQIPLNIQSTPFYFYDTNLLEKTLEVARAESERYGFHIHYALKANTNPTLLKLISNQGIGADCVSGNEILQALKHGFSPSDVVFAGVGKTDSEIELAIDQKIFCFNVESLEELEVINEIAATKNKVVDIAVRINPHVDAKTHAYITTGLNENKFGIGIWQLPGFVEKLQACESVSFKGIHFHIGSQITDLTPYSNLCEKINEVVSYFEEKHIPVELINAGGGLGIDYENPDQNSIPDFKSFFSIFHKNLNLKPHQTVHFELGRSLIGQCGSLISKVLYIKQGLTKQFAILDAGMTELMRPALYQSFHQIEKLNYEPHEKFKYDVVGPICESTDCFGKDVSLPSLKRGDLLAIRSAGAYGEAMASRYNLRDKVGVCFSNEIITED